MDSDIDANIPEYTTGVLRDRLFDQISNGWYPNLTFLLLTKRPSNINKYIPVLAGKGIKHRSL